MTPSTDLVLCKNVTYVFSASHTLYQPKMASVTVRYRKKNTKNIRRCKLKGRQKGAMFLKKKQPKQIKPKGSRNHDFHTGHVWKSYSNVTKIGNSQQKILHSWWRDYDSECWSGRMRVVTHLPLGYKGARNTWARKNHRAHVSTHLVGGFTHARVNRTLNYSSGK